MENTKLPVDNAALDAAYIENEPDEFITDMTDSHNGIDTADNCMKITLSVSADSDTSDAVGTRIDKFLSENLRDFSRSSADIDSGRQCYRKRQKCKIQL